MTGFWTGRYWYDEPGEPAVPFIANLDEQSVRLTGTISEPNSIVPGGSRLHAFVDGARTDTDVSFAKVYDGAAELAHRVDYSGTLSAQGKRVAGRWSFEAYAGRFEMQREIVADPVEATETSARSVHVG